MENLKIFQFTSRVSNNVLNKKILEALIFSDSLKSLEVNQNS